MGRGVARTLTQTNFGFGLTRLHAITSE